MRMRPLVAGAILSLFALLLWPGSLARADTLAPATTPLAPPVVAPATSAAPASAIAPRCTIAAIAEDIGANVAYLSRTRFLAPEAPPAGQPAICPVGAAHEATRRALTVCKQHAANPYNCVYGDMDHMFDVTTDIVDTIEADSQCASYAAKFIGIACQPGLAEDVCNVACGATASEATETARKKCKAKHDGECPVTNAVPVQAP